MADEAAGHADEQWQLDGDAAELYQRHLVPAVTAGWAADLVERAGLRRGEQVLDVACGTGAVARAAAGRVGRAGRVAGVDINAAMLAVARSLPAGSGSGVGWLEASALGLPFRAGSYDVVLCQLGLQFIPDRPAALAAMRRVLVPGGRLGLTVYGPIEHNPAAFALAGALDRHLGPGASAAKRAEHALADPALLRALAAGAGFCGVQVVTGTRIIRFASAADYVRIQASSPGRRLRTDDPDHPRRRAATRRLLNPEADAPASLVPAPPPGASPATTATALARALAACGITGIYTAAVDRVALVSVTATVTVWTDGDQIWCTHAGQHYTWPAAGIEAAAAALAALGRPGGSCRTNPGNAQG